MVASTDHIDMLPGGAMTRQVYCHMTAQRHSAVGLLADATEVRLVKWAICCSGDQSSYLFYRCIHKDLKVTCLHFLARTTTISRYETGSKADSCRLEHVMSR